ncbi:helix-turn-helix domain-containing protein [Winogradskyella tangerina]|uniref:helix-turn-helix domain-containing protein n=1 Tax=Winogradskyella tangerina TaxID=2023240 RepID=UPI000DBE7AF2|nr:helix-turn-helix domain-containing protein [Winogradskyella tangerina]
MVLMVIEISDFMSRVEASQYTIFTQKFHSSVAKTVQKYKGDIKTTDNNNYVVFFGDITNAVQCALDVQYKFKYVTPKHKSFSRKLNIALVESQNASEQALKKCRRYCEIIKDQLVITSAVKEAYQKSNTHAEIDKSLIRTLKPKEEHFINAFMDHLETHWQNVDLGIQHFTKALDLTYGQLFWRLTRLTGVTPRKFIKNFRLHKGMLLLHKRRASIAEVSNRIGFKSATHFSDSFLKAYGIRPSKYVQQHG